MSNNAQTKRTPEKQAKHLLKLSDEAIILFYNTTLANHYQTEAYKETEKSRKLFNKYNKKHPLSTGTDCCGDLRGFCIPFEHIPDDMFDFMSSIGWLDFYYRPCINDGFYSSSFNGDGEHSRDTIIKWFIDIDKYIDMLFCYRQLKGSVLNKGVA